MSTRVDISTLLATHAATFSVVCPTEIFAPARKFDRAGNPRRIAGSPCGYALNGSPERSTSAAGSTCHAGVIISALLKFYGHAREPQGQAEGAEAEGGEETMKANLFLWIAALCLMSVSVVVLGVTLAQVVIGLIDSYDVWVVGGGAVAGILVAGLLAAAAMAWAAQKD